MKLFKLYRITGRWPFRHKKLVCTFLNQREAKDTLRNVQRAGEKWRVTPRELHFRLDFSVLLASNVWE